MRNTRKSGQILRSKKRPRPTLRSGRGSRTNSNTSRQIPARVIEADSARAASAIANQRRGRPSNNRLPDVVRDHAIALVRELYADFGPTFAAEKLAERHDLKVSRETLRGWMRQAGIWMSRAER